VLTHTGFPYCAKIIRIDSHKVDDSPADVVGDMNEYLSETEPIEKHFYTFKTNLVFCR
jgi:hypothetical protein